MIDNHIIYSKQWEKPGSLVGETVLSKDFRSRDWGEARREGSELYGEARPEVPVTAEPPYWLKDVGCCNIKSCDALLTADDYLVALCIKLHV